MKTWHFDYTTDFDWLLKSIEIVYSFFSNTEFIEHDL